ncbi:MAG: cation diffusion facilitator family transporter [Clostridia bacterium]|nr:cation diffusion facilitator family transporter [Clostridia bacterium]
MANLLLRLFVPNYENVKDPAVREKYGQLGGVFGIICNLILCTLKIVIGTLTASISIVADGLNNLSDMGSSIITIIGFKLAGKPADSDHPFGHGRFEYLAAFIVSMLILLVGGELMISSVKTLIAGEAAPTYSWVAIGILVFSVVLKFFMFLFNRNLGKKIDSDVLLATAQDSINDSIATVVILVAALISMWLHPSFNLDAIMAIGVALFILWAGFSAARDTVHDLLGNPPEPELIEELEQNILSFSGFVGIHDLMVHNYGPGRQFASVHVEVPQDVDIVACHEQIDLCEKYVCERTGVQLVIHMDPIDVHNEAVSEARKQMAEAIRTIDERLTLHDFRMTPAANTRTNLIFDVVIPADLRIDQSELKQQIDSLARQINPTYVCVITFDMDYTGK